MATFAFAAAPSADSISRLTRDYDAFSRALDSVRAAQRGDAAAARVWPDDSPAAVAARKAQLLQFRARLKAMTGTALAGEDALDRDIIRDRVDTALEGLTFDEERIPFVSGDGFYTTADYAALATTLRTEADAEAWIARLDALPGYYEVEVANMRRGLATNFTQPRQTALAALKDLKAQAAAPVEASPLLKPFDTLPASFPADQRAILRSRAEEIVRTRIKPAQAAAAQFMEAEYLPKARDSLGASAQPGGAAYYRYLVRRHTTTAMTPEEIHALGEREIARIKGEMEAIKERVGFTGSLPQFIAHLRADRRFFARTPEEYGEKASEIAKRVDEQLPHWFGLLPRLTYGVHAIPAGLENSSAGYLVGSPEQGVAGMVVFKPWLAVQMPLYGLPAWVLHEGVPGHHLQIALGQERADLPEFRRNDDVTAFVEGWALYSEGLGEEMGIYRDDYERFGRLSLEMWRACRLVIDTGLHAMGWTRDQAMACLRENTALAPAEIEYEVDRYIAWPGQALAYKIGQLKISQLRARAEAALGPKFDIRKFHDLLIDDGPMPLTLLERRVDAWVAQGGR